MVAPDRENRHCFGPRVAFAAAVTAVAATFCGLLLATSPKLPLTWDEGNAIARAAGVAHWFESVRGAGGRGQAFSLLNPSAIARDWRYTTQEEGHPAFYGIVIAAGRFIGGTMLPPVEQARLGPILLFSLAAAAMFHRLWRMVSPRAAWGGVAALAVMPRLFAHVHFASFDGPLTSCWILTWAAFAPALRSLHWNFVWGVALGMTMSCKFTGWCAIVPFVVWAAVWGGRPAWKVVAIGSVVAALTFIDLNPPLWNNPVDGLLKFLSMNLRERAQNGFNIRTTFLGETYDLNHPLPWYNTLLWTGITVPVGILGLGGIGIVRVLRQARREPHGVLLLGHWLILVAVRALPFAPPHDAERLFLPSFAFFAALAGIGCEATFSAAQRFARGPDCPARTHTARHARCDIECVAGPGSAWCGRLGRAAAASVFGAYLGAATSVWWYGPQWLSYYNLCIGGLRGAVSVGMEPTYYWDGLDCQVIEWLDQQTAANETIFIANYPIANLDFLQRADPRWRKIVTHDRRRCQWYVIQHRPSMLNRGDRELIETGLPVFEKFIRPPNPAWGPWNLDVALISIYSSEQLARAADRLAVSSRKHGGPARHEFEL